MITYRYGDLLTSNAQTLVNPVNCRGVMGKGLAEALKQKYSDILAPYQAVCASGWLRPGRIYLLRSASHQWVANFPTKDHWRSPARLEWVESGLQYFVANYQRWGITSVAFPALGCGNGGLERVVVLPLMHRYLSSLPIPVEIWI